MEEITTGGYNVGNYVKDTEVYIGRWINNKPLYYIIKEFIITTTENIVDLSSINFTGIVDITGWVSNNNSVDGGFPLYFDYVTESTGTISSAISVRMYQAKVYIRSTSHYYNSPGYFKLVYTK